MILAMRTLGWGGELFVLSLVAAGAQVVRLGIHDSPQAGCRFTSKTNTMRCGARVNSSAQTLKMGLFVSIAGGGIELLSVDWYYYRVIGISQFGAGIGVLIASCRAHVCHKSPGRQAAAAAAAYIHRRGH